MIAYTDVKSIFIEKNGFLISIFFLAIILSSSALGVNLFYFNYQGVFYNPTRLLVFCSTFFLIILGFRTLFKIPTDVHACLADLAGFFCMLLVITLATNAVQLTPFTPIDSQIVAFEKRLGLNLLDMMVWAQQYPLLIDVLNYAYGSLNLQIFLLPILAIFLGLRAELYEYIFLMLVTMLIGFSFYYFYPTTAPASVFSREYFRAAQVATGVKFWQIHHHIAPSSDSGGLIALPSFHVIWAVLGTYLLRSIPKIMLVLVPVNILLVISCVLLGWHYLTDVFASALILAAARSLFIMHRSATKRREAGCENHAAIE